jgi:hypothetical protein
MAVFSGTQVKTGKRKDGKIKTIDVPVRYGNVDKVAGWIKSEGTQNKMLRLPIMSAYITEMRMSPELRKGINSERRMSFTERGRMFPEDIEVVHQWMPIPYKLGMELSIYTSNSEQMWQILEQILVLFDPTLQLQTTNGRFDWTKITTLELENINLDTNYPIGSDRNIRVSTLQFNMPVYLSIPANVRDDFVKKIMVRVGAVSCEAFESGNQAIIGELDAEGIEYKKWFDLETFADDVNIVDDTVIAATGGITDDEDC